ATGAAPTLQATRSGKSASSPQAEDHPASGRTETSPAPERRTEPTVICRASAKVAQVFGTHTTAKKLIYEVCGSGRYSRRVPCAMVSKLTPDASRASLLPEGACYPVGERDQPGGEAGQAGEQVGRVGVLPGSHDPVRRKRREQPAGRSGEPPRRDRQVGGQ